MSEYITYILHIYNYNNYVRMQVNLNIHMSWHCCFIIVDFITAKLLANAGLLLTLYLLVLCIYAITTVYNFLFS